MAEHVKKTGHEITFTDEISIKKTITDGDVLYTIHFPGEDNNGLGVDRTLTWEDFQKLNKKVRSMMSYSCPVCGADTYSHRRSELDWDIRCCQKCNWSEK